MRTPLSCRGHPLPCCAQSQHPERPVERSEPEVPGFRDYARNDEVERSEPEVPGLCDYARNDEIAGPTLCGEHRDVTLRRPAQRRQFSVLVHVHLNLLSYRGHF